MTVARWLYGAPLWVPVGEGLVSWFVFSVLIGLVLVARVLLRFSPFGSTGG
jgi:hypothetical protein